MKKLVLPKEEKKESEIRIKGRDLTLLR